jgi:uncharacterized repeat protein (TIGR01451 family)
MTSVASTQQGSSDPNVAVDPEGAGGTGPEKQAEGGTDTSQALQTGSIRGVIFNEGFEGATFPPTGWGQTPIIGTFNWDQVTTGTYPTISPHGGSAMARWNSYSISAGNQTRLWTATFYLGGVIAPALQFYMSHDSGYSTPPYDRVTVQISTNGGTIWIDLGTIDRYDATCTIACWKLHSFDLSSYIGQTVQIGFLAISQYGNNIFLDDVGVIAGYVSLGPDQAISACPGGTVGYDLPVSNMNNITDTLDLSWLNVWPTTVNPTSFYLSPDGTDTADVSVYVPWTNQAGDSDAMPISVTAQTSGLTDQAVINTTAALASSYTDYADVPSNHRTRYHSVVFYGSGLFDIGGYDGAAASARLNFYDIAANAWFTATSMNISGTPAPRYLIDCAEINTKIYCAGGYSTAAENALLIYNPSAGTWSTGAALPEARYAYSGLALNGKYYVIGGYTTSYQNTMIVYDPVANTWDSTLASMSVPRRYSEAGIIGGKIYVTGGMTSASTYTNTTEMYDPATNTWSSRASLPAASWVHGADGVLHNRYLVLAGGYAADLTASNYALAYDALNNSWAFQPAMPHMLYGAMGDVDSAGNFWIVSGRLYEGGFIYSRYTFKMNECAACTPVSGADFTVHPSSPALGSPAVFTATVTVGSPAITYAWDFGDGGTGSGQVITHTFTSAATYIVKLTATNCDGANSVTTAHTVVPFAADLSVIKVASDDSVLPGETFTYTIVVSNTGPATGTNVILTDTLPVSVTFVSASSGCIKSDGVVTCDLGNLAAGNGVTVYIVVTAPGVEGTITNTVEVTNDVPDPQSGNNTASANVEVRVTQRHIYLPLLFKVSGGTP